MIVEKNKDNKNTWLAKLKRTFTSVLPVCPTRKGTCRRCGACCKLPNVCKFLDFDEQGLAICKIYHFRPLNCRKYPRSQSEHITTEVCGYTFEQKTDS